MPRLKWILVCAVFVLSGCRQEEPRVTYTPPVLAEEWSVGMTQSGGIMGLLRSIAITSDGKFTANDQRALTIVNGELTGKQLTELQGLVSTLEFTPPKIPAVCADCFVYEVEIASGGKKLLLKADDVSLPDSGMAPLVEFLRGVMDPALK